MATVGVVPMSALDMTFLAERQWIMTLISSPFFLSFIGLTASYHIMAPMCATSKQASWILTAISSAVMSIASLPFLWVYFTGGGNVKSIRVLPHFAVIVVRFFQAYLTADLSLGSIYYRSRISLLGGWIHHSVYVLIVELAVRRSWSHMFCLAGSMEIPTFIFAIATFYPQLRNDVLFAVSFFMTRILFHLVLFMSYLSKDSRIQATEGSFMPAIILAAVFPLHTLWFIGCIKGFMRRAADSSSGNVPPISSQSTRGRVSSGLGQPPTVMAPRLSRFRHLLKLRLHRRQSFERVIRSVRRRSRSAAEWVLLSRTIFAYIPPREAVLDCVGLRRKDKQEQVLSEGQNSHQAGIDDQ